MRVMLHCGWRKGTTFHSMAWQNKMNRGNDLSVSGATYLIQTSNWRREDDYPKELASTPAWAWILELTPAWAWILELTPTCSRTPAFSRFLACTNVDVHWRELTCIDVHSRPGCSWTGNVGLVLKSPQNFLKYFFDEAVACTYLLYLLLLQYTLLCMSEIALRLITN